MNWVRMKSVLLLRGILCAVGDRYLGDHHRAEEGRQSLLYHAGVHHRDCPGDDVAALGRS